MKDRREYYRQWRAAHPNASIEYGRKWRLEHPDAAKEYNRERQRLFPERTYELSKNWIKANPEKRQAHVIVYRAIKNGTLKRQPCEICANHLSQAHHSDYKQPLLVTWLCAGCHKKQHRRESV